MIQSAINSATLQLGVMKKAMDMAKMQQANLNVAQQRLAIEKQKLNLARAKERNKMKLAEMQNKTKMYQAQTDRKRVNQRNKNGMTIRLNGKEVPLNALGPYAREQLKGGGK